MYPNSKARRRWLAGAAVCALYGTAAGRLARANNAVYPRRAVSIIVPAAVGSPLDTCMREAARLASPFLGAAEFRIANRPGAAQLHGASALAALAQADGHQLAMSVPAWMNKPLLYDVNYEPLRDFSFIVPLASAPYVIAVRADSPWRDLTQLLADARRYPGKLRYGAVGYGEPGHLLMEETARQADTALTRVLVRKRGEAVQLLVSGRIDLICDSPAFAPQLADGSLRLLAQFGDADPLPRQTRVPAVAEAGVDIRYRSPFGLAGPHGLPPDVVRRLHDAFSAAMQQPAYGGVLDKLWFQPHHADSAAFSREMHELHRQDGEWMRRSGLLGY